jgi:hypothetical protein
VTTPVSRSRGDDGAGMLGTVAAIVVFLVFLLFAVQLLVGLWGRSVVTAAAYDGARHVAGHRGQLDQATAVREAEDRIRHQLGGIGRDARITWPQLGPDQIEVRVEADNPRLLSPTIAGPLATDHIDRTVVVRVERDR